MIKNELPFHYLQHNTLCLAHHIGIVHWCCMSIRFRLVGLGNAATQTCDSTTIQNQDTAASGTSPQQQVAGNRNGWNWSFSAAVKGTNRNQRSKQPQKPPREQKQRLVNVLLLAVSNRGDTIAARSNTTAVEEVKCHEAISGCKITIYCKSMHS